MALSTSDAASLASNSTWIDRVEIANANFATAELAGPTAATTNEQSARISLSTAVLSPEDSRPLAEEMAIIISTDASNANQNMVLDPELLLLVAAAWNSLASFFSG